MTSHLRFSCCLFVSLILLLVCQLDCVVVALPRGASGASLIDKALALLDAFGSLNASQAVSYLSSDAILMIDGQIFIGAPNITSYLSSVFSTLTLLNENLIGEPVMTTNYVAWEKEVVATLKNGTVVKRTEIEWFEFDLQTGLIVAITSLYNSSSNCSGPTDPRIAAALLFQTLAAEMNATALGLLFEPQGDTNIPIGVASNEGRDAITSNFAAYFSGLTANDEGIVGDGIILSEPLNAVAFTKVITATHNNGTTTKTFVVNWFVFAPLIMNGSDALPLIRSFSAVFNLSSNIAYYPFVSTPSLPSCLQSALGAFSGAVCLPGSTCYADTLKLDNERLVSSPLVVLWPQDESDVSVSVIAAQKCALPFSVRGGGHSAAGYCLTQAGITIDMRLFNKTYFSPHGYFMVGAGMLWSQVYAQAVTQNISLVVGGTCASVCVGGYTLGGGVSRVSRLFGLAIDNLLEVTAVLANGTSTILSDKSGDPDLWWAIRGGGGGNFAVITLFTFRIPPQQSPLAAVITAAWPPSSFTALLSYYARWAPSLARSTSAYLLLTPAYATLEFCDLTNTLSKAQAAFDELLEHAPSAYNISANANVNFLKWEIDTSGTTSVDGRFAYVISEMLNATSLSASVSAIVQGILHSPTPFGMVIFSHVGGAMNVIPTSATAFPYRSSDFLLEVKAIWPSTNTSIAATAMDWASGIRDTLYTSAGVAPYINYIDPEVPIASYYGENFARLQSVKKAVDPTDLFHFAMSIPGQVPHVS